MYLDMLSPERTRLAGNQGTPDRGDRVRTAQVNATYPLRLVRVDPVLEGL